MVVHVTFSVDQRFSGYQRYDDRKRKGRRLVTVVKIETDDDKGAHWGLSIQPDAQAEGETLGEELDFIGLHGPTLRVGSRFTSEKGVEFTLYEAGAQVRNTTYTYRTLVGEFAGGRYVIVLKGL